MAERKDKTDDGWKKYARRRLVKSYLYLILLFFGPMAVFYWLGAPLIGCVAAGFLAALFGGLYTLEMLPAYGDTFITGGQGKVTITLEEFNRRMRRNYLIALPFSLIALGLFVLMFHGYPETGRIDQFWFSIFVILVLAIRVICAPVKKVLLLTVFPIMIFSPFVFIGHLVWTARVLLSTQPYSEIPADLLPPSPRSNTTRKMFAGEIKDGKIVGEWLSQ